MNRKIFASGILLALFVPTAAMAAPAEPSGLAPESMRAELTRDVVDRWQPYVSEKFGDHAEGWSERMAATLRSADIANLELAASADNFQQMNAALLGGTKQLS